MRRISVCILIGALAGCGGNVKNIQCSGVDWTVEGYERALSGESVRGFDSYRNSCGNRLEAGAMNAYVDGYGKGIAEYCTYDNGYAQGYSRKPLREVCPVELRSEYERGYKFGKFALERRIENVRSMEEGKGMSEDVEEMEVFKREP